MSTFPVGSRFLFSTMKQPEIGYNVAMYRSRKMCNYFISVKDIAYKYYDLTLCIFVLKENFTSNPDVKRSVMQINMVYQLM